MKKSSKKILDNFSRALEKVKVKKRNVKEIVGGFRDETEGVSCDNDFRERMFENAPKKTDNCIISEVKNW